MAQFDSLNAIDGAAPPKALQLPNAKLLVSPVVPACRPPQLGLAVDPTVTAIFTAIDEPLLNTAFDPPPSPIILNSEACQSVARSTTVSLPVVLNAWVVVVKTNL